MQTTYPEMLTPGPNDFILARSLFASAYSCACTKFLHQFMYSELVVLVHLYIHSFIH